MVRQAHHKDCSLLQVTNDLMAVLASVLPTADMDPVILAIRCFEDELVKVNMMVQPIHPLMGKVVQQMPE